MTCHAWRVAQVVVIDCRAHMLGRLASVIAKELLAGQHVVRVLRRKCLALCAAAAAVPRRAAGLFRPAPTPGRWPRPQVAVRTEDICISGGIVRQQMKYDRFKTKAMVTCPRRGPYHYRSPSKILWRTIRGCAAASNLLPRDISVPMRSDGAGLSVLATPPG